MGVPLELVKKKPDDHPLVARLRRYVSLADAEVASLKTALDRRLSIKKKRDIILEGYEARRLHVVDSGFAARYKLLRNGRRQVLDIVLPGDIIGMPSAFFRPSPYSVTALSDVTVQSMALDSFFGLCRRMPMLAIAMLWYAEEELASYADHVIELGRRSPLERVAHFLLQLHSRLRVIGCAAEQSFDLPLSQEVIGDLLGLSAPHVNRMLHQLSSERLISMKRRHIVFEDRNGLQLLAQFEPLVPSISLTIE